ncbi:MAG TPA: hypothetical protein VLC91_16835 [Spongiibacteraceae bacterium]|nr:hypothetical protein [Spongiibacteraceae bacterium]
MKTVHLPDGSTADFPDEMADSDIASVLSKQYGSPQPAEKPQFGGKGSGQGYAQPLKERVPNAALRALLGYDKSIRELGRGAGQLVGIEDTRTPDEKAYDESINKDVAGFTGNVVGSIANTLPLAAVNPVAAAPIGSTALASALPIAANSAIQGGLAGLIAPVDESKDGAIQGKAKNVLTGAALGGLLPAIALGGGAVARGVREYAEPIVASGKNATRQLMSVLGDPETAAEVLRSAQSSIPGYRMTTAEVLNDPSVAMFQRAVEMKDPMMAGRTVRDQSDAALRNMLNELSGSTGARQAAEQARSQATAPLYQAATNRTLPVSDTLEALIANRPSIATAVNRAEQGAADTGGNIFSGARTLSHPNPQSGEFVPETFRSATGQGLQDIKKELDTIIEAPANNAAAMSAKRHALDARQAYKQWISDNFPELTAADTRFAELSDPINRMDIWQHLQNKLVNPAHNVETEGAASLAANRIGGWNQAQQDAAQLYKRATGRESSAEDLSTILGGEGADRLRAINDALIRRNNALSASAPPGSPTAPLMEAGQRIASGAAKALPIPYLSDLLQGVERSGKARSLSELSSMMADPAYAARMLSRYRNADQLIRPPVDARALRALLPTATYLGLSQQ